MHDLRAEYSYGLKLRTQGLYLRAGKRMIDAVLAALGILALSPILLIVGLLIMLTDPGPILFRQERVGRNGILFRIYKFRTMPVGTKILPSDKLGPITLNWFARLLRRTNLDELPQLYNILKGEMSIVGPRPPIPSQVELLQIRAKNGALCCRPGLTGLAQVNGYNGMPVPEKAGYDGQYASQITFSGDARIVMRTISYLSRPPPVY